MLLPLSLVSYQDADGPLRITTSGTKKHTLQRVEGMLREA